MTVVEGCREEQGVKDELGGLGWSNENRSAKAARAGGGSDRLSDSWTLIGNGSRLKARQVRAIAFDVRSGGGAGGAEIDQLRMDRARNGKVRASARDPAFALSVSSVDHREEIKPSANAASPAAIGPMPTRTKVPRPLHRRRAAHSRHAGPQSSHRNQQGKCGQKLDCLGRPEDGGDPA